MCQSSKNFGNQDNIVDTIWRTKQIFKVSSVGQGHVIVIIIIIIIIIGMQHRCSQIHARQHAKRSRKF